MYSCIWTAHTCTIWSSFLIESDGGAGVGISPIFGELGVSLPATLEPARGRDPNAASLVLLDRDGIAEWCVAPGDDTRAGPRGC
jgi:hypothetical protein